MKRSAVSAWLILILILLVPSRADALEDSETDVMLLIDLSGTMKQNDPHAYRYVGAEQFLTLFSYFGKNKAGVVTFGDDGHLARELSYITSDQAGNYRSIFAGLTDFENATEMGKGLEVALAQLTHSSGRAKSIIVISDGRVEGNVTARRPLNKEQADAVAEQEMWNDTVPRLKALGIKVYTIGLFGQDRRGERTLDRLARETGGFFEAVNDPAAFSKIYQKMLYDFETPADLIPLNKPGGRIKLTPADIGLIVTGPKGFSLTDPHGRVYPGADTPVRQEHFEYADGGAILFLERPSELSQLDEDWTGDWGVKIDGEGQAALLSPVRIIREGNQPLRPFYFKNEYVPLRFGLAVRSNADRQTRDLLNACVVDYTVVPEAAGEGGAMMGKLEKQAATDVYANYQLVEKPGAYRAEIQMGCTLNQHGKIKFAQVHERFDILPEELLELDAYPADRPKPSDQFTVGDLFKIKGELTKYSLSNLPFLKSFTPEHFNLTLHYPSGGEQKIELKAGSDETEALHYDGWGDLTIDGEVSGTLVMTQLGRDDLVYHPFKAKTSKTIHSTFTLAAVAAVAFNWLWKSMVVATTLMTFFVFVRHRQWKPLQRMSLRNSDIDLPFGEETDIGLGNEIKRDLRAGPRYIIGGPDSDADVKLPGGDAQRIAEIGVAGPPFFQRFYIRPLGSKDIYLNERRLEAGVRATIKRDDGLRIDGMEELRFEPTDPIEEEPE